MELINTQHGLDYKYCPDEDAYISFNKGEKVGKFPRRYAVDPYKIWETKARAAGYADENGNIDFNNENVKQLKPTQTVFKIWEHSISLGESNAE